MSSKIEWTDQTYNPIIGCSKVSPGCLNCYAERMACRLAHMNKRAYQDVTQPNENITWFEQWNSKTAFVPSALDKPLKRKKPTMYFVCSMGDLWHPSVPFAWIDRVMAVIALCPQHTFQFLSKREKNMKKYFENALPRVAALVYNEKYGQRKSIFGNDKGGRIGDRFAGPDMASQETTRKGREAGGRLSQRGNVVAVQESEGGIHDGQRVSLHYGYPKRSKNSDRGPQSCLVASQRTDTRGIDNQSQGRSQIKQPSRQSGINDIQPTETPCFGCSKGQEAQAAGEQAPENISDRESSVGNEGFAEERNDGERYSCDVQDDKKGNVRNLYTKDVEAHIEWPLPNIWLGVTAENQAMADKRIPILKQIPAAVRFVSVEPLLEGVEIPDTVLRKLDWVIIGAESGPNRRPCRMEWVESVVDQCKAAGVPVFVKQVHDADGKLVKMPVGYPQEFPDL